MTGIYFVVPDPDPEAPVCWVCGLPVDELGHLCETCSQRKERPPTYLAGWDHLDQADYEEFAARKTMSC